MKGMDMDISERTGAAAGVSTSVPSGAASISISDIFKRDDRVCTLVGTKAEAVAVTVARVRRESFMFAR